MIFGGGKEFVPASTTRAMKYEDGFIQPGSLFYKDRKLATRLKYMSDPIDNFREHQFEERRNLIFIFPIYFFPRTVVHESEGTEINLSQNLNSSTER